MARCVLRDLQHVRPDRVDVPRRPGVRPRPDADARWTARHPTVLHDEYVLRRIAGIVSRRNATAAWRVAELSRGPGQLHLAGDLEVPRRLGDPGEHHVQRTNGAECYALLTGLQWRYVYPPGRHVTAARFAWRPADVPPGVSQLRRSG